MTLTIRKCETCLHFYPSDDDVTKGLCKLNPPASFPIQTLNAMQQPQMTIISLPVNVTAEQVCGYWYGGDDEPEGFDDDKPNPADSVAVSA